jgi:hypothetical protein
MNKTKVIVNKSYEMNNMLPVSWSDEAAGAYLVYALYLNTPLTLLLTFARKDLICNKLHVEQVQANGGLFDHEPRSIRMQIHRHRQGLFH